MKFIHCSDLHLDSKMEQLSSEKSKTRREEILRTFEKLCEYAKINDVKAVIIAGDMFDTSRVLVKTRQRVLSAISSATGVDFLYLSGNHDDDNFISQTEILPENLKVFTDEWATYSYGDVKISGVKFTNTNAPFIADTLSLREEDFNIVTLHGQVAGYNSKERAEIISIPAFKNKHIDYMALGHIHTYAKGKIDQRGEYAYSGTLDGRGFDELGQKGFVLIDVMGGKAKFEFVDFSSRNLYEHTFDVQEYTTFIEAREELIKQLTANYSKDSLIKVVLLGAHKPDFDIDKERLTDRLNELFFFAKVYDKTELKIEIEDYLLDKSVRGEFVRAVWESNLDSEQKKKVILCGLSALKGEEI